MPNRDFTKEDVEAVGWNLVDRMLARTRPQQQPQDPAMILQRVREVAQGRLQRGMLPKQPRGG